SLLEEDTAEHQPLYQVPALFVFDELAQLGHMPIIEDQIAIARSAKIRMWLIAQDLPQLKRTYPRWESMLGNCRTQILFGVNDLETATYVSHRAGDKTTVYEETRPLVTPTELMGPTFVDKAIIFARGTPPIQAYLPTPYHADEDMREIERFLDHWDATLTRRERTEETTSASEDADDDENVDETGGEAEVEEADCVDQLEGDDRGSSMVTAEADVPLAEDSRIGVGAATEGKTTEPRGTSRRSARTGPNNRPRKPVPKSSKANVSASQPSAPRKKPRPRKRPAPPSSGDE
ncbi:type IV secretory system conjugative DNA transfer family protein, partial [Amorphus sp. MBR-141]